MPYYSRITNGPRVIVCNRCRYVIPDENACVDLGNEVMGHYYMHKACYEREIQILAVHSRTDGASVNANSY